MFDYQCYFFTFIYPKKVWLHVEPHPGSHLPDYTHSHSGGVKHETFFSVFSYRSAPLEQLTRSGALLKGTPMALREVRVLKILHL